jgi:hypothetical protein
MTGNGAHIDGAKAMSQLIEVDSPGSLTVNDLTLSGGYACTGGALGINSGASTKMTDVTVDNNSAGGQPQCGVGGNENTGGAISNAGTFTISASSVSDDEVTGYYACGGAISNSGGTLSVTHTLFSGDEADGYGGAGGAVCDLGGTNPITGTFSHDTFMNNTSTADGQVGGRQAGGGAFFGEESYDTITQSGFSGNAAVVGGAVSGFTDTVILQDDSMSGNSASAAGGAVSDDHGYAVMTDDTLSGNSAGFATAILSGGYDTLTSDTIVHSTTNGSGGGQDADDVIDTADLGGSLTMSGTVVAGDDSPICFGVGITDGGYNIDDDASCDLSEATSVNNSSTIDGDLVRLGNYGGSTKTAPTREFGQIPADNALCATADQRGVARTSAVGCDVGAFQSDITSTNLDAPSTVGSGKAVKLAATVDGNYPAGLGVHGTVTFMEGATVLARVPATKKGIAAYTIAPNMLARGNHVFSASFAGPVGYDASVSATVTVHVR